MDNSTMIGEENKNRSKQARYCFQYFDEECDVGIEDENGERVRKRKRPGRKPNPPSQQERRAQNRMAQRNFREREQQKRLEKEKQWNEYMEELTQLRKRVARAEYEANYLRGWVLQLLLASIAQRGSVPQVWIDTRCHPVPHPTMMPYPLSFMEEDEALHVPAMLDLLLNEDTKTILDIRKAVELSDYSGDSTCPLVKRAQIARKRQQKYFDEPVNIPPPPPSIPTPCNFKSIHEILSTDIISLNTECHDVRFTFPSAPSTNEKKNNLDINNNTNNNNNNNNNNNKPLSSPSYHHQQNNKSSIKNKNKRDTTPDHQDINHNNKQYHFSPSSSSPTTNFVNENKSSPTMKTSLSSSTTNTMNNSPLSPSISPSSPSTSSTSTSSTSSISCFKKQQTLKVVTTEVPTLKKPEDLSNMPPLQALHILRLQLKISSLIGEKVHYALCPTALQRLIPHDIRIDYVPAGSIRDKMIIFQDYFDMDECFQLLTSHSIFVGGDIRDCRNWVLDPIVTEKYWFFSHHLFDHHFDDCHVSEEFLDTLREWTMKKYNLGSPSLRSTTTTTTHTHTHTTTSATTASMTSSPSPLQTSLSPGI
ncbi:unnamed protein product [Cunninghamella blakesleeana]